MTANHRASIFLDGTWQILFDPDNRGRHERWFAAETFFSQPTRQITVPSCWEEIEQDYEGVAWYGRTFAAPPTFDQVVQLVFHAANYRAEVWLNGEAVGYHDGGYTAFSLDVSGIVQPGATNTLIVRVIGPLITRDTVIDGIGLNETPHWRGAIAGGLWQPVELVATPPTYVRDVFVAPDIHAETVAVHLELTNAGVQRARAQLTLAVGIAGMQEGQIVAEISQPVDLEPGTHPLIVELALPNAVRWSPENPHLYRLETGLTAEDGQADAVSTRFGMREFTVADGQFTLNDRPIYIKAAFWECLYPNTLANPPSKAMVIRELTLAQEMGINLLRPWRKPLQPWIADLADEMGMLLVGGIPVECMNHWPEVSPQLRERITTEVRESVLRDRNHPSIVWWELFNEVVRPELGRLKHKLAILARSLDPSRLIADESGGWWGGAHLYLPHSFEPIPFNELHRYLRNPVNAQIYDALRTMGRPEDKWRGTAGQASVGFLSEVGFGGLSDLPKDVARYEAKGNPITPDTRSHKALLRSLEAVMHAQGLYDVFESTSALCGASQRVQAEGNKLQVEAVRLNPHLHGFAVHAYTDGDWVYGAGILDMWREPKQVYHTLKEAYAPLYLALRVTPSNLIAGQTAALTVTAINEGPPIEGTLVLELAAPGQLPESNQSTTRLQCTAESGVHPLLETPFSTTGYSGEVCVSARLVQKTEVVTHNALAFFVLDLATWAEPMPPYAAIDPHRQLSAPSLDAATPGHLPIVVASEDTPDDTTLAQFEQLFERVKSGSTAILLKPPIHRPPGLAQRLNGFWRAGAIPPDENRLLTSGLFPIKLRSRLATGMWVPVNHIVKAHPIFDGLPSNQMMGHVYQNVCPAETLLNVEGQTIVGALSFEWNADHGGRGARNYLGCQEFWWGSSLVITPMGKGRLILSTLRLLENLGQDPVADIVFRNLVRYASAATIGA